MKLIREKDIPEDIWRNSPVRFQCCPPVKCSNECSVFTWQNSSSLIVQGFGRAGPTGTECQQSQPQSLKIPWRKVGAHHEPHGLFLQKKFHALEKEIATHSSVLAWRIPWMAEPGGVHLWSHTVGHNWSASAAAAAFPATFDRVANRLTQPLTLYNQESSEWVETVRRMLEAKTRE